MNPLRVMACYFCISVNSIYPNGKRDQSATWHPFTHVVRDSVPWRERASSYRNRRRRTGRFSSAERCAGYEWRRIRAWCENRSYHTRRTSDAVHNNTGLGPIYCLLWYKVIFEMYGGIVLVFGTPKKVKINAYFVTLAPYFPIILEMYGCSCAAPVCIRRILWSLYYTLSFLTYYEISHT